MTLFAPRKRLALPAFFAFIVTSCFLKMMSSLGKSGEAYFQDSGEEKKISKK